MLSSLGNVRSSSAGWTRRPYTPIPTVRRRNASGCLYTSTVAAAARYKGNQEQSFIASFRDLISARVDAEVYGDDTRAIEARLERLVGTPYPKLPEPHGSQPTSCRHRSGRTNTTAWSRSTDPAHQTTHRSAESANDLARWGRSTEREFLSASIACPAAAPTNQTNHH